MNLRLEIIVEENRITVVSRNTYQSIFSASYGNKNLAEVFALAMDYLKTLPLVNYQKEL